MQSELGFLNLASKNIVLEEQRIDLQSRIDTVDDLTKRQMISYEIIREIDISRSN